METGSGKTVVFVAGDGLGTGDAELGALLLRNALKTLGRLPQRPDVVTFMNAGVRLCCRGSSVVDDLAALAATGTELLCCGTCLDFFHLKDELAVGRVSNMLEILSALAGAARVVRL